MVRISYSAVNDWRACPQRYHYRYVDGLRPKVEDSAPTLGRILHHYMAEFYTCQQEKTGAQQAHIAALEAVDDKFEDELEGLAFAAQAAEQPELAQTFVDMPGKAKRIAQRYLVTRGLYDYQSQTILHVEVRIEYPLDENGLTTACVIDLITEDDTGTWLWEHKTTGNVPEPRIRLKDLQTTLYVAIAEEALGVKIDGIRWNYLRTKEPTTPDLLRNGTLTRRSNLDSDWPTYLEAVKENGLEPDEYEEVRLRLLDKEESVFFPRYEVPLVQNEGLLLRDFIITARQIDTVYGSGGMFTPVRNVGFNCNFCPFEKLCRAKIMGGDEDELIKRHFKRKEAKGGTRSNS